MEENKKEQGRILACVGGLYTVESSNGIYSCKARGLFRKNGIIPYAGDMVVISEDNVITEVLPRKNSIIRPPLANLDQIVFVVSSCKPAPNLLLLDKFIAVAKYKNITPILVITKWDLKTREDLVELYRSIGIRVISVEYDNPETIHEISDLLSGKCTALTGNSGAGKSTLLNALDPSLKIAVNDISEKLGRGKHTTRQATFYPFKGGYVADTPGFSTFETNQYAIIAKEKLADCFSEFEPYQDKCQFSDCAHVCEKGCKVIEAVKLNEIPKSRHDSYIAMYEEAKKRKDWE
ncbi:MAG: ribosome small subunit-dependent GTPase A [Ruminococcus sp.]|nr:ribosome small subunit-dependent GTPase A [Ruminococcus sp.]